MNIREAMRLLAWLWDQDPKLLAEILLRIFEKRQTKHKHFPQPVDVRLFSGNKPL